MDRLEAYRRIVQKLLQEYSQIPYAHGKIDQELVFDKERDHYELLSIGWEGARRIHHSVIHIDIRGDKVWLQQDNTDAAIAEELVERGIPKTDIVLGFQPEHRRPYTGYAVA
ncbi:MAG: XisI protein [Chloroflexota bacterium]